jgi:large subunit ribosomal protein L29
MSAKELRAKAAGELQAELIKLRREQFSLRMQAASGQAVKSSDFGKVKKSIARVKTVMTEKASSAKSGAGAKK